MEDTIAAIATALGEGGIGIVRISGENALPILQKIFRGRKTEDKVLTYGHVYDNFTGDCIDEVMAVYMKGPHSYTAENVVEIQCHGSIVSLRKILSLVLRNGARLAEPGEFTKRAFLNGRLDLSQAEAVIDLIRAKSDASFDVALGQLEGKFILTYEDSAGNETTIERPFSAMVQEMDWGNDDPGMDDPGMIVDDEPAGLPLWGKIAIGAGCAVLICGIVFVSVRLRKAKKRRAALEDDEDDDGFDYEDDGYDE